MTVLQRIKKAIADMKLKKKLLISYLLVVFLPILIIGYFFISNVSDEAVRQNAAENKTSFMQEISTFDRFISNYVQQANNMKYDNLLTGFLNKKYSSEMEYADKFFDFNEVTSTYSNILAYQRINGTGFKIYTDNSEILFISDFIDKINNETKRNQWYSQALDNSSTLNICTPQLSGTYTYTIPVTTVLTPSSTVTNILQISIPEKEFYALIDKEAASKTIYIVNENLDIITSTDRESISKNLTGTSWKTLIPDIRKTNTQTILKHNNSSIYIGKLGSGATLGKCWMIMITSNQALMTQLYEITGYSLGICLLVSITDILLILLFSHQITTRLQKLVNAVRNVRSGSLRISVNCEGEDEIAVLGQSFNEMMERINTLIYDVYTSELRLKDSRLKAKEMEIHALQSQINPHFLFNSLALINTSVLRHKDFETSDIIISFSRLIRKNIEWKSDLLPLQMEFSLIEDYLKIQTLRHRNKLSYKIEHDHSLDAVVVPKFILQPLVENSICHGIEAKKDKGMIIITCNTCGELVKITVSDNGVGIDRENLEKIRENLSRWEENIENTHIGIVNVHQRLKLYYGEESGVEITSEADAGTAVTISFPRRPVNSPGTQQGTSPSN